MLQKWHKQCWKVKQAHNAAAYLSWDKQRTKPDATGVFSTLQHPKHQHLLTDKKVTSSQSLRKRGYDRLCGPLINYAQTRLKADYKASSKKGDTGPPTGKNLEHKTSQTNHEISSKPICKMFDFWLWQQAVGCHKSDGLRLQNKFQFLCYPILIKLVSLAD